MKKLAEICLAGLDVGGNYVRCLGIVAISMGIGKPKRFSRGFKVIVLRWMGGRSGKATRREKLTPLYTMKGVLTI